MANNWNSLPQELKVIIFELLDKRNQLKCRLLLRKFQQFALELLYEKVELDFQDLYYSDEEEDKQEEAGDKRIVCLIEETKFEIGSFIKKFKVECLSIHNANSLQFVYQYVNLVDFWLRLTLIEDYTVLLDLLKFCLDVEKYVVVFDDVHAVDILQHMERFRNHQINLKMSYFNDKEEEEEVVVNNTNLQVFTNAELMFVVKNYFIDQIINKCELLLTCESNLFDDLEKLMDATSILVVF